jgi:hypothetical protein
MKNDPFFKYVAAVIISGVILAFASPSLAQHGAPHQAPKAPAVHSAR